MVKHVVEQDTSRRSRTFGELAHDGLYEQVARAMQKVQAELDNPNSAFSRSLKAILADADVHSTRH